MTDITHTWISSPLTLIDEWRDSGAALRELLVMGYTVDLAFLERFCIPQARGLGARITILTDPGQAVHDAVDVRWAGRAYQHGFATTPRAFHPKLAVLLGDDAIWAAIGSGNPTMAGWGHNHELWWVLRGSPESGPAAQAQLSEWLRMLPDHVGMPTWIAATVREIGTELMPRELDDSHAEITIAHNLLTPIIDALPGPPATELRLAAPFFDPSGTAVRVLAARAGTPRLRIAVQPRLGQFDGAALTAAAGVDAEFVTVAEERTLHGKLIEWQHGNLITALSGSANITAPALLRATRDGANSELGVLSPVPESLFPTGVPITCADVATIRVAPRDPTDAELPVRLLGCRLVEDGVRVEFIAAVRQPVDIEASLDGSPGSWMVRASLSPDDVAAGTLTTITVAAPDMSGGVIRLAWGEGPDRRTSAEVFVTDVRRCRPRTDLGDVPRLRQVYEIDTVLADEAIAKRFSDDLQRLLELSAQQRTAASTAPLRTAAAISTAETGDDDRWQRFLDAVSHSLGAPIAELVFPGALTPPVPTGAVEWLIADGANESELVEGESDTDVDEFIEQAATVARIPVSLRGRYRQWASRWVKAVRVPTRAPADLTLPTLPLRMTVANLYTQLLAAGVWGTEASWRTDLADLVRSLTHRGSGDDSPQQNQAYLGALVGICLDLLGDGANLHGGRPADVVYRQAWEAGHQLVASAEPAVVQAMVLTSSQPDARVASADRVMDLIVLARSAALDPLAEAKAALEAEGYLLDQIGGVWVVDGEFSNPVRVAARAVTDLDSGDGAAAIATNGSRSTLMMRRGPVLVMADSKVRIWRIYDIRPPATPASRFACLELPSALTTRPLRTCPPEVLTLAADLGVELTAAVGRLSCPP